MKLVTTLLILIALSFSACGTDVQPKDPNAKPEWIYMPNQAGKIGAVGTAGRTYDNSMSSRRKLAIQRALDELSLQQNVKVELHMQKQERVVNSKASLMVDEKSSYTANNTLSAHIEAIWMDRSVDMLYVWMVLNK